MRRRAAFTLVEMMVSVALVLFIMVILTEAFGKGLESFRTLKAIGDMESRLRAAASILRRDLEADHFEAKRRLSEDSFTWKLNGSPREGVFTVMLKPGGGAHPGEGSDADGIPFRRSASWLLHFTAKARGNNRSEFYTATIPGDSRLLDAHPNWIPTNFFKQPADARFQDQPSGNRGVYSSQWAELAYFLEPSGQQTQGEGTTPPMPLYTLYRCQYVMIADDSRVNYVNSDRISAALLAGAQNYDEMSCVAQREGQQVQRYLYRFFTPAEAAIERRQPPDPLPPDPPGTGRGAFRWSNRSRAAMPLLTEVVSMDVALLVRDSNNNIVETDQLPPGQQFSRLSSLDRRLEINGTQFVDIAAVQAVKITLRVYETKTKQTRQMTLVQDL